MNDPVKAKKALRKIPGVDKDLDRLDAEIDKDLEELFKNLSSALIEQGYIEDLVTVVQELYWKKLGNFSEARKTRKKQSGFKSNKDS